MDNIIIWAIIIIVIFKLYDVVMEKVGEHKTKQKQKISDAEVEKETEEDEHTRLKKEVEKLKSEARSLGLAKKLDMFFNTLEQYTSQHSFLKDKGIALLDGINIDNLTRVKLDTFSFSIKNNYFKLTKTNFRASSAPFIPDIDDPNESTSYADLILIDENDIEILNATIIKTTDGRFMTNEFSYLIEGYKKNGWVNDFIELFDAIEKNEKNEEQKKKEIEIQKMKNKFSV